MSLKKIDLRYTIFNDTTGEGTVQAVEEGIVQVVVPLQVVPKLLEIQPRDGAVVLLRQFPKGCRANGPIKMAVNIGQWQRFDEIPTLMHYT